MDHTSFGVFLFVMASSSSFLACSNEEAYFNLMDYGATSDGFTDDSQAFVDAWNEACSALVKSSTLYVPAETTFLVNPITFHGPCNASTINFLIIKDVDTKISGTIIAPESARFWEGKDASQWLGFMNIDGLNVDGFGLIDGRGKAWWDQSCKYHPQLKNCTTLAPTAWKFIGCKESSVRNMKVINSGQTHILVKGCDNFIIENVVIDSPGNSPNTDGIHIQSSQHLLIIDSIIGSGDDCISIGDYTTGIEIANIKCGPGHGISIGSLGRSGNYVQVQNIHVAYAFFNGTSNGARIKTWQVGRGYVRDVTFENILFYNVKNPIIIDQNYCNIRNACEEQETGVQISNVVYRKIGGTSISDIAINLNCSRSVPCYGISMESIKLMSAKVGKEVTANCSNSYGQEIDVVPSSCLQ